MKKLKVFSRKRFAVLAAAVATMVAAPSGAFAQATWPPDVAGEITAYEGALSPIVLSLIGIFFGFLVIRVVYKWATKST